MPITAEVISERAAAISEKEAAKAAIEEATVRYENAKKRIEDVHTVIAADLLEGETRVLVPTAVPVLMKKDGKIITGTLQSIHPDATGAKA